MAAFATGRRAGETEERGGETCAAQAIVQKKEPRVSILSDAIFVTENEAT